MPCPARRYRRRRGWSGLSYRRERKCSCTWILRIARNRSRSRRCRLITADSPAGRRAVMPPPHPADHEQLDRENQQGDPHHRADGRHDDFRLYVNRVPDRDSSPVAALAREPIPDREGDGEELSRCERGARADSKGPLENRRPFSLVVAGDAGDIPRIVQRDVRASPAGELEGIGTGAIEEPKILRVLSIPEVEVKLARVGRRLCRNLDRD